jgi:predicted nucleic acid-binding protein
LSVTATRIAVLPIIPRTAPAIPAKPRAQELVSAGGVLSVQILNEFTSVARKKLLMSWANIGEAIEVFLALCPEPVPITADLHQAARDIAGKYGYDIYDALVLAAALEAGCSILYSEDLQDKQLIGSGLTIRNPFTAT